jgi:5-formyltetrahydrofolate cyclo-ligase
MKAALAALPEAEAARRSNRACEQLAALAEFAEARTVMLYVPIPGELDCLAAVRAGWERGKTVLVPRVSPSQAGVMHAIRIDSEDDLEPGSYGIREPREGTPWPLDEIDMIVVPALAFDRAGHRLGRGGGFYDRFLARRSAGSVACGVGFSLQIAPELPREAHDQPLDMVVTDTEVIRFR